MKQGTAIFLTGGGARGPFQIGFFKALEESGIKPELICGSSVGALVGGAATYMDSYEMLECWKTLTLESVLQVDKKKIEGIPKDKRNRKLYLETFLSCCRPPGLLIDIENIRKLLYASVDGNKILDSNVNFGISTTQLPSFKICKILKKDMICNPLEYILASLYLPIFRPQKIIDGKFYLDISSSRVFPFDMVNGKDYTQVIIVNVSSHSKEEIEKDIKRVRFSEGTNVIIVNMNNKSSLLDFSEEQAEENYQYGYEKSVYTLNKKIK